MKLVGDTITVFNKYVDNETKFKRYKATVINGIHWYGTANVSVTVDGLIGADQYTIRIPEEADFSGKNIFLLSLLKHKKTKTVILL